MPTIIRATDHNRATHGVAFNFDDMAVKANGYLERVRADAAKIVEKARAEADAVRAEAQRAGREAGMQAIEELVQQRLATVLPALHGVVEEIGYAKQAWLKHWEAAGVHVAGAIAARLVRRELAADPQLPLTLLREALELAAGSPELRIRLNPADHEALGPHVETLVGQLADLASTELIADTEISRGGCRVETRFGSIDQQFETQLERIEEELA